MKKKTVLNIFAALAVLIAVIAPGCVSAPVSSSYSFKGDGSGTAEFAVYVLHTDYNGPISITGSGNGKGNDEFFPKGYNAALDYLATQPPEDWTYYYEDKCDHHIVYAAVEFSSVQDLNAKYKSIAGNDYNEGCKVWSETEIISDDEYDLTIGVPYGFGRGIIKWMSKALLENSEVFSPYINDGGKILTFWDNILCKFDITITFGGQEMQYIFDESDSPGYSGEVYFRAHTITARFNGTPPETTGIRPRKFYRAEPFKNGVAVINYIDNTCRYPRNGIELINTSGDIIVPLGKYINLWPLNEGFFIVRGNKHYTILINNMGEIVSDKYYDFQPFSEGLSAAYDNTGKCGFINKTGEVVIPFKYDCARPFSEGLAAVGIINNQGDAKWGYIDKDNNLVIDYVSYRWVEEFKNGLAVFRQYNGLGLIDKTGSVVVPCEYVGIVWNDDLISLCKPGNIYMDKHGYYYDNLKWGCVDLEGNIVIGTVQN